MKGINRKGTEKEKKTRWKKKERYIYMNREKDGKDGDKRKTKKQDYWLYMKRH